MEEKEALSLPQPLTLVHGTTDKEAADARLRAEMRRMQRVYSSVLEQIDLIKQKLNVFDKIICAHETDLMTIKSIIGARAFKKHR